MYGLHHLFGFCRGSSAEYVDLITIESRTGFPLSELREILPVMAYKGKSTKYVFRLQAYKMVGIGPDKLTPESSVLLELVAFKESLLSGSKNVIGTTELFLRSKTGNW